MNERIGKNRAELLEYVEGRMPEIWQSTCLYRKDEISRDPTERIVDWRRAAGCEFFEEFDHRYFVSALKFEFGCDVDDKQLMQLFEADEESVRKWWELGRYDSDLTNRQLAEWIVDRIPRHRFESVNIAGVDCLPAGIFWGMRDLLKRSHPHLECAPSTPLVDRLTGADLDEFWNGLRTQTRAVVPALVWPYRWFASAVTLVGILLGFIGGIFSPIASGQFWAFVKAGWGIAWYGNRLEKTCVLPDDIITFGDLARHLARAQVM